MKAVIVCLPENWAKPRKCVCTWGDEEHHPKLEGTVCGFKMYSFWQATGSKFLAKFIAIKIKPHTSQLCSCKKNVWN